MPSDTVLKDRGMRVLAEHLGIVDAEKFITLVRRDTFDYTEWRRDQFNDLSVEELSARAQAYCDAQK